MNLLIALSLPTPARISIVGAGGKTTLAFALAREYAGQGGRVLVTTTTAMFHPDQVPETAVAPYAHDRFFQGPADEIPTAAPGEILLAARSETGSKIKGYDPRDLARVLPGFDAVIVEADGARMRPLKAPAAHEPAILPETRTLIACIGLDCLGRPVDEAGVHRPEIVREITGAGPEDPIIPEDLIRLVADDRGSFKGAAPGMDRVLILNKADTPELVRQGRELVRRMKDKVPCLSACLVTCLKDAEDPVKAGWPPSV